MQRKEDDCDVLGKLVRDICYLYHDLSDYGNIMGSLSFGDDLCLPYWEFLEPTDHRIFESIPTEDAKFIRTGCLVMILSMAVSAIEDRDYFITGHLCTCRALVDRLIPEDISDDRLIDAVKFALDMVENKNPDGEALASLSQPLFIEHVLGYFAEHAARRPAQSKTGGLTSFFCEGGGADDRRREIVQRPDNNEGASGTHPT